jgi:HEAT repeat protein
VASYRAVMSPDELVELLGDKESRVEAIRQLMGGVNARELRQAVVAEDVFQALVGGTHNESSVVRWWSVQLLDHCPDERAYSAVVPLLDDPVDRVRRNAVHALGCRRCKPPTAPGLDSTVIEKLRSVAVSDPNPKVRHEAAAALLRPGL